MFKRILTLVLALLLVMQVAVFADPWSYSFYEELYDDGIDEANGKVYYVAGSNTVGYKVKFAMDMGLIKSYDPNNTVTKEDLKKALDFVFGEGVMFEKYFTEAELADALTIDEAIIVFMDAAGYGPYLKAHTAGDAFAYRAEAQRRGLLTSIKYAEASKNFTAEMFYKMFYDALYLETIAASYSNKGVDYYNTERTLMDTELDLVMFEGIVTGNSYTTLLGDEGAGEGSIFIDGNKYSSKNLEGLDEFLGYSVHAYLDENNNLCSIAVDERINVTKTLDDSVEIKKNELTKTLFPYWDENDRVKKLELIDGADVIYNHIALPGYQKEDLDIDNGYLKFIDNNNDKKYDVVFIEEWVSFLPKYASSLNNTIEDRLGNIYDFTGVIESQKYKGVFDYEGNRLTDLTSFTVNTAVSVLVEYGTLNVTEAVRLKEETYEGVLNRNSEAKAFPIKIGDYEFKLGKAYFGEKTANFNDYKMGTRLLVYVDQFGKIIKAVDVQGVKKFGWVMSLKKDDDLFDTGVKIYMFTENDKFETYPLAKRVTYNINELLTPSQIMSGSAIDLYNNETGKAQEQLIKYTLNGKGEVCAIETADKSNNSYGATSNSDRLQLNYEGDLMMHGNAMMSFGAKYQFDKATVKFFNIPKNRAMLDYYRVDSSTIASDVYYYGLRIYDVNETYRPAAILLEVDPYSTWVSGELTGRFIINKGSTYYPAEDEVLDYIEYGLNDWYETKYIDPEVCEISYRDGDGDDSNNKTNTALFGARYTQIDSIDDVQRGDVIDFTTNYDNRIMVFMVSLALDHTKPYEDQMFEDNRGDGGNASGTRSKPNIDEFNLRGGDVNMFGKVVARDERYIVVNCHKDLDPKYNRTMLAINTQKLTIYDVDNDAVIHTTPVDVQVGDFIYVEMAGYNTKNHIVYRNSNN